ncbi:MAG: lysoplasmalogenase [Treponema sp.]|nr:lysoplasmalogenase [Treponema sp.]
MAYIPACIFAVVSVIHLTGCIMEKKKLCFRTKPILMPLLAVTASAVLIPHLPDAKHTLVFTVAALACGTAGDIFLLSTDEKHFAAGALCFLTGHICWITQYSKVYTVCSPAKIVIGIICTAVLLTAAYFILGKPRGIIGIGTIAYGAVLCMLVFTGTAAVYTFGTIAAELYLAGALLFLVSDSMLGFAVIKKPFPRSQFFIMLTYIAAQILLTAAVIFLQLQSAA